jgi:hypothetical protein
LDFYYSGKCNNISNGKKFDKNVFLRSKNLQSTKLIWGAPAALIIYKKEILQKIGSFDPDFFAYEEDVDLALRLHLLGYQTLYIPQAICYHMGGATSKKMGNFRNRMDAKNWIYIIIKNYPTKLIFKNLFSIIEQRLRNFSGLIKNIRPSQLPKDIFITYYEVLFNLPKMFQKRRHIQKMLNQTMIIGIDVSSVAYQTGVSNYTLKLVQNLISTDTKNHYKLFFSSLRLPLPAQISQLKNKSNVTIYHFRFPPTFLQILSNQLHIIPVEFLIGKCDIFHTSDWTQPPTLKANTITTDHDLTPFLFPQWHHPKVIKAHRNKMYWAAKDCSKFICVSQNTKSDLIKLFPKIDQAKITVVYEAAEDKYKLFHQLPQKNPTTKNISYQKTI